MIRIVDALVERGEVQAPREPKSNWVWRLAGIGLVPGAAQRIRRPTRLRSSIA